MTVYKNTSYLFSTLFRQFVWGKNFWERFAPALAMGLILGVVTFMTNLLVFAIPERFMVNKLDLDAVVCSNK